MTETEKNARGCCGKQQHLRQGRGQGGECRGHGAQGHGHGGQGHGHGGHGREGGCGGRGRGSLIQSEPADLAAYLESLKAEVARVEKALDDEEAGEVEEEPGEA